MIQRPFRAWNFVSISYEIARRHFRLAHGKARQRIWYTSKRENRTGFMALCHKPLRHCIMDFFILHRKNSGVDKKLINGFERFFSDDGMNLKAREIFWLEREESLRTFRMCECFALASGTSEFMFVFSTAGVENIPLSAIVTCRRDS